MKTKRLNGTAQSGLKSKKNYYRTSRDRTTTGQSQALWTLVVAIAVALAALTQLRAGNKMEAYQSSPERGVATESERKVDTSVKFTQPRSQLRLSHQDHTDFRS